MMDYNGLRKDLVNYFGTALSTNPMAMADLIRVENSSNSEIVKIAANNGFDLNDYNKDNDNEDSFTRQLRR